MRCKTFVIINMVSGQCGWSDGHAVPHDRDTGPAEDALNRAAKDVIDSAFEERAESVLRAWYSWYAPLDWGPNSGFRALGCFIRHSTALDAEVRDMTRTIAAAPRPPLVTAVHPEGDRESRAAFAPAFEEMRRKSGKRGEKQRPDQ